MGDSPQTQQKVPDQDDNRFYEVQSDMESDDEAPQFEEAPQNSVQRHQPQQQEQEAQKTNTGSLGGSRGAVREPRIKDREESKDATQSTIKVKVELDLEAEVDLYARVKGDVTVGLL